MRLFKCDICNAIDDECMELDLPTGHGKHSCGVFDVCTACTEKILNTMKECGYDPAK